MTAESPAPLRILGAVDAAGCVGDSCQVPTASDGDALSPSQPS